MKLDHHTQYETAKSYLSAIQPDDPVYFFSPRALGQRVDAFQTGFNGMLSYAVKANCHPVILENMVSLGVNVFDVASPAEMQAVRAVHPTARLHYHNPLRSYREIQIAKTFGIASWSIDSKRELDKLGDLPPETEIAVRIKLDATGGHYNFGEKFGASLEDAASLLRQVQELGLKPTMTFHPGTQCSQPDVWGEYIAACHKVASAAGVTLSALNVGGGFAAHRQGPLHDLTATFRAIQAAADTYLPDVPLVCEPGRALVADAMSVALCVKVIRDTGDVVLNDGMYGALAEWRDVSALDTCRYDVLAKNAELKQGAHSLRKVFGPTCDSLDCVPFPVSLPIDLEEGDYALFHSMGAYSQAIVTAFNGYGATDMKTVHTLSARHP